MSDNNEDNNDERPIAQAIQPIRERTQLRGKSNLTTNDKVLMLNVLHTYFNMKTNKLEHGCITKVAKLFGVNRSTIRYVWGARDKGTPTSRMNNSGRRPRDLSINLEKLPSLQLEQRTTIRSTCEAIGVSTTTFCRRLSSGEISRHSSTLVPLLSERHKINRLKHCLSYVNHKTGRFHNMINVIHIYEK